MTSFDRSLLAEKIAAVDRHLARVEARLPADASELAPCTDASDAVILHLWQAVQLVIDLALAACVHFRLGTPPSYGDAFRYLARHGRMDSALAERLARAAGFRNVVAHAYEQLDMERVHLAATSGPPDLRAFLRALADQV
jgi:uncharacterized protein YutE (UPF0331/DUF86 family)